MFVRHMALPTLKPGTLTRRNCKPAPRCGIRCCLSRGCGWAGGIPCTHVNGLIDAFALSWLEAAPWRCAVPCCTLSQTGRTVHIPGKLHALHAP